MNGQLEGEREKEQEQEGSSRSSLSLYPLVRSKNAARATTIDRFFERRKETTLSHPILGELAGDLTERQRSEVDAAILENPDGVRRVVASIGPKAHSPVAVLLSNLKKGHHRTEPTSNKQSLLQFALALHTARNAAYPPNGDKGWSENDAIVYAVDQTVAVHGCNARRLEQQLREHLGLAANSDVATPDVRRRWISVHRRLPDGMLKTIDEALATPPRAAPDDDLADLFRKAG